jgi:hypothetical protein
MNQFTGRDKQNRYWYKGERWLGPTNELGRRTRPRTQWVETRSASKEPRLVGTLIAQNAGPFTRIEPSAAGPGGLVTR